MMNTPPDPHDFLLPLGFKTLVLEPGEIVALDVTPIEPVGAFRRFMVAPACSERFVLVAIAFERPDQVPPSFHRDLELPCGMFHPDRPAPDPLDFKFPPVEAGTTIKLWVRNGNDDRRAFTVLMLFERPKGNE